ncbi:MAG: hypothetical protein IPK53_04480 [bacterium]|nr:hypothetical protein [bacterium]
MADSLYAVRAALAKLYIRTSFADSGPESKNRFDELNHAKRQLSEELLARHQDTIISEVLANCNANGIASLLPLNSVVVDYVRYDHDITLRQTEPRYLACVIRPDSSTFVIQLGGGTGHGLSSLALRRRTRKCRTST